jgi:hypothetical protein
MLAAPRRRGAAKRIQPRDLWSSVADVPFVLHAGFFF